MRKRSTHHDDHLIQLGLLSYDRASKVLYDQEGKTCPLRAQSLEVLECLAEHAGDIVSKSDLVASVWVQIAVSDDSLTQCIADIRRTIGDKDRTIIQTVSGKGYRLVPTRSDARPGNPWPVLRRSRSAQRAAVAAMALVAGVLAMWFLWSSPQRNSVPTLHVATMDYAAPALELLAQDVDRELRTKFGQYQSLQLLESGAADYQLNPGLREAAAGVRVTLQLIDTRSDAMVFSDSFDASIDPEAPDIIAARAAAAIASPLNGAVTRIALAAAVRKPVEALTESECFAQAYQINPQAPDNSVLPAIACLRRIVEEEPANSTAWALYGLALAHQHYNGTGLTDADRDAWSQGHFRQAARDAAERVKQTAGNEAMINFALASVYFAACDGDKIMEAIRRATAINPDDPWMLGAFANWAAYTGNWQEGVALAERALAIQRDRYAGWWWWPIAKQALRQGDYATAEAAFRKAYVEKSWIDEVHLAQVMVLTGRDAEAREAVQNLRRMRPGFTRDDLREAYETWCFTPEFLIPLDAAMVQAGLPSRAQDRASMETPAVALQP